MSVADDYRAWVGTLGELSPRQQAEASHLIRLAEELDLRSNRPAAALASLSRAVAKTADRLRDERNAAGVPAAQAAAPQDVADELKARRERRVSGDG